MHARRCSTCWLALALLWCPRHVTVSMEDCTLLRMLPDLPCFGFAVAL